MKNYNSMDWVDFEELSRTVQPSENGSSTIHGTNACSEIVLTIFIAMGGNVKRMIIVTNHVLLFDSAYARRAEKARDQFGLAYKCCEKELGLTAGGDQAQYRYRDLGPCICPTAIVKERM